MTNFDDFDGHASIDYLVQRAKQNDRYAAELIWQAIAAGEMAYVENREWVIHVGHKVVQTLIDNEPESKQRPQLALQAIGLAGPRDRDEDVYRELIASTRFDRWNDDAEIGAVPMTREEIAEYFIRAGWLPETSNLRAAAKRLDRIEKKFGQSKS